MEDGRKAKIETRILETIHTRGCRLLHVVHDYWTGSEEFKQAIQDFNETQAICVPVQDVIFVLLSARFFHNAPLKRLPVDLVRLASSFLI